MKGGAHGRWRGLQWEIGHTGGERGGATMRYPMCLLMKVAYARKISAVRWHAVNIIIPIQVQTSVFECSSWPHREPELCPHSASIALLRYKVGAIWNVGIFQDITCLPGSSHSSGNRSMRHSVLLKSRFYTNFRMTHRSDFTSCNQQARSRVVC